MKVGLHQRVERATAREAIKDPLADGFKILALDGEQTMLKHSTNVATIEAAMFTTDENQLRVEHQHVAEKDWVSLIYGNDGHDVIADRATNLELPLKGAPELADKITDEDPAILIRMLTEIGA